jgi:hypothetical protein
VKLDREMGQLLGSASIGMLALNNGRLPLVNPAAFTFAGGSVWMTTSRHAVKVSMARRDPRAAFLVSAGRQALLFQGLLEVYDFRTVSGQVRAALEAPRFAWSMASYAFKNAAFVGGYLIDLAAIPRDWWPQNRVVLRLKPDRLRAMRASEVARPERARLPGTPPELARQVARNRLAYACWGSAGSPVLAPAMWAIDAGDPVAWLPEGGARAPSAEVAGALVVEYHHPFRATRMTGACLRGRLVHDASAAAAIEARYGVDLGGGTAVRLRLERATWWRGFQVHTTAVTPRSLADAPAEAEARAQARA